MRQCTPGAGRRSFWLAGPLQGHRQHGDNCGRLLNTYYVPCVSNAFSGDAPLRGCLFHRIVSITDYSKPGA